MSANAEQAQYWTETAGPKWVRYEEFLDRQLGPLGERAMDHAAIAAGERVLDVGCGCGHTTITLARRVGPTGRVLGVDISESMLARARARGADQRHVRFALADAQTHRFDAGAFDAVFSRFGVMFFADPTAAFANLRTALRAGGRLAFVCWQSLPQNGWLAVPLMAAARHIQFPPPPAPGAPGPFAFADADRVRGILEGAGFRDVAFDRDEHPIVVGGGGSLDDVVDFLLDGVGPTSAALREAGPEARPKVAAAVRDALAPYATADGVSLPAAAWIVTARA
jgi:SAM-dependent methyltransferase